MMERIKHVQTLPSNRPIDFQSISSHLTCRTKSRSQKVCRVCDNRWTLVKYVVLLTMLCGTLQNVHGQRQRPINYPPLITRHPDPEVPYKVGDRIELHCSASGEPEYSWQFENGNGGTVMINKGDRGNVVIEDSGTLVIKFSKDFSSGVYQCFAKNSYGTAVSRESIVKEAVLKLFDTVKEPMKVNKFVGTPVTIRCFPPDRYPLGAVYWSETTPSSKLLPIDTDARISLDYEGNLHFANLVREDSRNGVRYVCTVSNTILGSQVQGYDHVIEPQDATPTYSAPKLMWSSNTEMTAVRGRHLKMKCIFSGFPTPTVQWRRIDGSVSSRFVTPEDGYGQEMEIKEVETGDAGKYQCFATNSETGPEATEEFDLTVQSEPYWKNDQPPRNVLVSEEGDAKFECKADGDPTPKITWTIDGRPIEALQPDPRISVTENVITFTSVTLNDTSVIQCNASNSYGYIFANVYLAVRADPPIFIDQLQMVQKIAENQNVQLKCSAEGAPQPTIVWSKDGVSVEPVDGRIDILPNGHLKITKASLNDAGEYKCTATNKFGFDDMRGQLIVRERTVISAPPTSQTTVARSTVTLPCSVTTDEEEVDQLSVAWFRDGLPIVASSDSRGRFYVSPSDRSLTIRESSVADTAAYSCEASNGLDSDRASAQLIVKDRPEPPSDLHLTSCDGPTTTTLTWQPGNANNDPITDYVVYYNTSLNESESFNVADADNSRTITFGLKPWRSYLFFVRSRNSIGDSDPRGLVGENCVTPPSTPSRNPSGVCSEMRGPGQLVVVWEPLTVDALNGDGFRYVVSYRRLDVEGAVAETQLLSDRNRKELQIDDQEVFKPYEVYVQAANDVGPSTAELQRKHIHSSEGTPAITPENFRINSETLNCTSVEFAFDPIDEDSPLINGFFRGYQVRFWKTGEEDTLKMADLILRDNRDLCPSANNRKRRDAVEPTMSVVTNDLWPFSKITAGVVVLNGARPGIIGSTISFDSPEGVPGAVFGLRVTEVGSFHMKIRWNPPLKPNGILTGYVIEYFMFPRGKGIDHVIHVFNPLELKARLLGLEPYSTYVIQIMATTSIGRGEAASITATTLEGAAPDKPFISDYDVGDNSVNISWSTFEDKQVNPGSEYYVEYKKAAENDWSKANLVDEEDRYVNVTNLHSGFHYIFTVVAANEKFKTTSDEVKVAIGDVAAVINDTTVVIEAIFLITPAPVLHNVASSGWFIAIMIIIALIILAIIIIIFACRERGDKYPVWEKEKECGKANPDEEKGFGEYVRRPEPNHIGRQPSWQPSLIDEVSEEDEDKVSDDSSIGDYDEDPDTAKFNEDGSFIGRYGKDHRNGGVVPVSP